MIWFNGPDGGGYKKRIVCCLKTLNVDVCLLKISRGACINEHTDPDEDYDCHRLNLILREAEMGGQFVCNNAIINWRRLIYYRPDIHAHKVSTTHAGETLILSIGWKRKKRK